ncbi:MAG TPA: hypothetical protein VGD43_02605 [Micromonospora sp.]
MAGRDPQEKKALSYARDRRNNYGQSDKAARRLVRTNKRTPNRADRHREHQVLRDATGSVTDPEVGEAAEIRLLAKKSMWMTKRWRKRRDSRLADAVAYKLTRRARLGIDDPASVEARVDRVYRRIGENAD